MSRGPLSRALSTAAVIALGALVPASCANVIGADPDAVTSVAAAMCKCNSQLSFLGTKQSCEDYLDERFRAADEEKLATWLDAYVAGCTSCGTVLDCFYQTPVCKTGGCTLDEECCSEDCKDGTCE